MINYICGDMFLSDADCLVNTVNCEGYMGKGIAYQFKLRFPNNNMDYVKACKDGSLLIGTLHHFKEDGKIIINFPTKDKWRNESKLSYIESGLDALLKLLPLIDTKIIAIPPLGCGNGGLLWCDVKKIISEKLAIVKDKYEFNIYEPSTTYKPLIKTAPQLNTSSLVLMQLKIRLKKFNSLRLQKAAYFTNIYCGEQYFKFDAYKYGPYAHSIDIISRSIREYQEFYCLKDTLNTYDMAYKVLCSEKTIKKLNQLKSAIINATQFVNSIISDKDLEGVSTVVYIIQSHNDNSDDSIMKEFQRWSEDKAHRFKEEEILNSIKLLDRANLIHKNIVGYYELSINDDEIYAEG